MKKLELASIKECVKNGDYSISSHSYGASSMGYLVNFRLDIKDPKHHQAFNRQVYYVCFSSHGWYVVKYEGVFYNHSYHAKYKQYDDKIEAVIYGDKIKFSESLC